MKIAPRFSLLRQLAWAATLAIGFGTVWFVLAIWIATRFKSAWNGGRGDLAASRMSSWSSRTARC